MISAWASRRCCPRSSCSVWEKTSWTAGEGREVPGLSAGGNGELVLGPWAWGNGEITRGRV